MPIPPNFSDLGKVARDLLSKDFNYGSWKVNATTKSKSGVEFKVEGSQCHDTGAAYGHLETKHAWKEHGVSVSEKWNTDNVITTEATVEDKLVKGLKVGLETALSPVTDKKNVKVKVALKNDFVHATVDTDLAPAAAGSNGGLLANAATNASAVVGYNGWLGGVQVGLDLLRSKMTKNAFSLGYCASDFTLHTYVNDCQEYGGSVYHRITDRLEGGATLAWVNPSGRTRFSFGAKYLLDKDAHLKTKLTSDSHLGVAYVQALRPGIKLTLSTLVDVRNFSHGGHKLGFGIDLDASS
jgi:hypothetical protein